MADAVVEGRDGEVEGKRWMWMCLYIPGMLGSSERGMDIWMMDGLKV